ncbi:glycosyltransferase family 39 protein [Ktedonospora formicarum]|uniref:Glycosyltransferase RgtA/B/C/D-like domain-containing protein n=1 Tax=Ktedonospora formicarum TaxID=2778364 RepID=A0A8J3I8U9_9CHLR|nr:glycosyltransferase family 39 protein [Ktedonospora formicarum]GHO49576.1 hypothetical protein KSX_77390 [Ktedonospora formicarum]
MLSLLRRRLRFDKYSWCAIAIILLAFLLRFFMIAQGWPVVTDDEGPVGLMARHIAYLGAHPLFYYGQDYMGPLEAYLGAAFFWLLGPSPFSLRLGLVIIFALFLICFYALTARLYSKGLALFSLALLSLGTPEVIFRQLSAAAGTPEYIFFVTLLLLLTSWLAFTATPEAKGKSNSAHAKTGRSRLPWYRLLAYAAWGAIAGLAIWSHLLSVAFVVIAGPMLILCCYRELRPSVVVTLLLMLFICVSPQLLYKFFVPTSPTQASLFGGGYHETSGPAPLALSGKEAGIRPSLGLQIAGNLMVTLPIAIDANGVCSLNSGNAWPLTSQTSSQTLVCSGVHGAWGIGFLVLWFMATIVAAKRLWINWRRVRDQEHALEQRHEMVRQAARLTLLLSAGAAEFVLSFNQLANAVTPWTSSRYLVGVLIATPAVLSPLWENRQKGKDLWRSLKGRIKVVCKYSLLLLILLSCLLGTFNIFTQEVPRAQATQLHDSQLVERLLAAGATRIYTNNWMCDRLAFESDERIICSALDQHLHPGLDRYFPYRAIVAQDPHPFYVFPQGSVQTLLFVQLAKEQHIEYVVFTAYGCDIYRPTRRVVP